MYVRLSVLHNLTRVEREGDIDPYSSPSESPDRVRKKKETKWLARTLKPEVALFSSGEIGIKNSVFRTELYVKGWAKKGIFKKLIYYNSNRQ